MSDRLRRPLTLGVLLFIMVSAVTALIYSGVLDTPFLYDDTYLILEHRQFQDPSSLSFFLGYNRPVVALSYALDFALHGVDPAGYRLFQVLLHLLNGLLVVIVVRRMNIMFAGSEQRGEWLMVLAALAGCLYILHPVHSMTVILVSARSGILCAVFYLAGLLAYLQYMERDYRGTRWLAVTVLYLAACLSKEIAITFPLVCLLLTLLHRRVSWRNARQGLLKLYTMLIAVSGGLILHSMSFRYGPSVGGSVLPFNRWEYLMTQAKVVLGYVLLVLGPYPGWLTVDHEIAVIRNPLDPAFLAQCLVWAGITAGCWWLWRRGRKGVVVGVMFFFLTLLPTSSLVPIADLMMEYRLYLPAVGLVLAFVFALAGVYERLQGRGWLSRVLLLIPVVYLVLLGVWLHQRVAVYGSPVTLWQDTVRKAPAKVRPRYNLAYAYGRRNMLTEARSEIRQALELEPRNKILNAAEGDILREMGHYDEAIAAYRRALEYSPDDLSILCRVTYLLIVQGRLDLAAGNLELIPRQGSGKECQLTLAIYLVETGRLEEALVLYRQITESYPAEKSAWLNMGNILFREGNLEEAGQCYRNALAADPYYARADLALGLVCQRQGRMEDAWRHLAAAREKNPHLEEVKYEMANWLATMRQYQRAAEAYRRFLAGNPEHAEAWFRLALVLGEQGELRQAGEAARRAQILAPDTIRYQAVPTTVPNDTGTE
jgi:tetratricopeptide (TPR) repeat protein